VRGGVNIVTCDEEAGAKRGREARHSGEDHEQAQVHKRNRHGADRGGCVADAVSVSAVRRSSIGGDDLPLPAQAVHHVSGMCPRVHASVCV